MENTQNLSNDVTERNRGIEKSCSNPQDSSPNYSFVSWDEYLAQRRIHEEARLFVDYLINHLLN